MTNQNQKLRSRVGDLIAKQIAHNRKIEALRRLRRIDQEVLTIEGLAEYLHCAVPTARAIPPTELPRRSGPGRRVLFLKDDVHRYLRRSERQRSGINPEMVRSAEAAVLGSKPDSEGRRSRRSTGND